MKLKDNNGKHFYSKTIIIPYKEGVKMQIKPNPATSNILVAVNALALQFPRNGTLLIRTITVDISTLSPGTYVINLVMTL